MHLAVEKIGFTFRVLVSRVKNEMQPTELFYSGSAVDMNGALAMAEDVGQRMFAMICAPSDDFNP
jgi:hypothetical protein